MRRRGLGAILVVLSVMACGGAPPPVETADEEEDGPPPTYAIALRLADAGTDENETPRTPVSLVRIAPDDERTVAALRQEIGACYHVESTGALMTARCWWAGHGGTYVVRREGDSVVALRTDVHEEGAPATPEEVGRVEVPADAELQVLAPGREAPIPE